MKELDRNRKDPVPQGKYVPAVRFGNFIFIVGMTPRRSGVATMARRAVLQGEIAVKPTDKVCFVISGGNVAFEQLKMLNDVVI